MSRALAPRVDARRDSPPEPLRAHSSTAQLRVARLRESPLAPTRLAAEAAAGLDKRAEAERIINERLGSAMLTVTNLCRWTGMSRSSLYRLFDVDGGVQAFIRARRLHRVAEDLRSGAAGRLADIAERWGFCDAAYLARVFREVHGVTPSAYRRASAA